MNFWVESGVVELADSIPIVRINNRTCKHNSVSVSHTWRPYDKNVHKIRHLLRISLETFLNFHFFVWILEGEELFLDCEEYDLISGFGRLRHELTGIKGAWP